MTAAALLAENYLADLTVEVESDPFRTDAEKVQLGDFLDGRRVIGVDAGPKYMKLTVRTDSGPLADTEPKVIRRLRNADVCIVRRSATPESVEANARQRGNRVLATKIENRFDALRAAQARMNQALDGDYAWAEYNHLDNVMQAQAKARILSELASWVESAPEGVDIVAVHEKLVEAYTRDLLSTRAHRGLSKSTSVMSNILEDVLNEAKASFLEDSRWGF